MSKGRMEAFSDGVIAIIITIMVLEISAPTSAEPSAIKELLPGLFSYILSFVLGTYWVNHHHLLQVTEKTNGRVLWANLLFLFMLSLFPVCTNWISITEFAAFPMTVYISVMLLTTLSYILLHHVIANSLDDEKKKVSMRIGRKEWVSVGLEIAALILSLITPIRWACVICMIMMKPIWLIPDLRVAKVLSENNE